MTKKAYPPKTAVALVHDIQENCSAAVTPSAAIPGKLQCSSDPQCMPFRGHCSAVLQCRTALETSLGGGEEGEGKERRGGGHKLLKLHKPK